LEKISFVNEHKMDIYVKLFLIAWAAITFYGGCECFSGKVFSLALRLFLR